MFVGLVAFWLTEGWASCKSAELFFVYWVVDHAEFKYDHQNGVRRVKTDQKCSKNHFQNRSVMILCRKSYK